MRSVCAFDYSRNKVKPFIKFNNDEIFGFIDEELKEVQE